MLAGVANYLIRITANKMGLTPIYKNIERFMLHHKIVKVIKESKFLKYVAKQRFIRDQRKFWLFTNFFTTRLWFNFQRHGLKYVVKKKLTRRITPQFVKSCLFCWKTIKYFKTIDEKIEGFVPYFESVQRYLQKKADYISLWILGRYKNETERFKRFTQEKRIHLIYQYADILESLVQEKGQMRILMNDKYDDPDKED